MAVPDGAGGVIMGADSAGVAGWDLMVRSDAKVFQRGPFLMGFTTSFRMGQLLQYTLESPARPEGMDDAEYMSTVFVDAVRKCLSDGGWKTTDKERETGGEFLVGFEGVVYHIASDFQVAIPQSGYSACGCGAQVALGSLHATGSTDLSPKERVEWALEAAESFSAGVRGPFVILKNG